MSLRDIILWAEQCSLEVSLEHSNETSGFVDGRRSLYELSECKFLNNNSAAWNWVLKMLMLSAKSSIGRASNI
jgi:hypothetical protein